MSDIAALMAQDPQSYSEQDLDAIIEHYRKLRAQFNSGAMRTTKPRTTKSSEVLSIADQLKIDL